MKFNRHLFVSIAMILCSVAASAQETGAVKTDTVKKEKNRFLPTGIRLGTDLLTFARSSYDKSFTGWEVNADVDLSRYYVTFDYGNWSRTFSTDEEQYWNDGHYYRVGVDVNFLKKDPERNMFFIGARYGHATFSESLVINKTDPVWGDISSQWSNSRINGNWFELTTGIRVKMWKMIWMGYTARFKFGLTTNETSDMLPHDVPGYGNTDKDSYWGFNYQIFLRLPVRKQPVISTEGKKK